MRGQPKLIKRKDSPYWFIYLPRQGNIPQSRYSTGKVDYESAKTVFAHYLLESQKPIPNDEICLNDLLDRYAAHKSSDKTVEFNLRHLKPFFKDAVVSQICNALIRSYIAHRASQPAKISKKPVSPSTIRRELDTLSAALGYARKEGYIKETPYIEKPKSSPPRERWLTRKEFEKLWKAAGSDYFRLYLAIAIATGARPSSILELKWFQIDLQAKLIHFNPEGREQTKKYRPTININRDLLPILKQAQKDKKSEWVIARKNGKRVGSIKKAFKIACKKAGLVGVTPYVLRHTVITWAIRDGATLAKAGQLAGHMEPRTTMRYAKHDPSFTKDITEKLASGLKLAKKRPKKAKKRQNAAKNIIKKQYG